MVRREGLGKRGKERRRGEGEDDKWGEEFRVKEGMKGVRGRRDEEEWEEGRVGERGEGMRKIEKGDGREGTRKTPVGLSFCRS